MANITVWLIPTSILFGTCTCILYVYTNSAYDRIKKETYPIDVDSYVKEPFGPSFVDKLQCVLLRRYAKATRGVHDANDVISEKKNKNKNEKKEEPKKDVAFPIVAKDDPNVPGLKRTYVASKSDDDKETSVCATNKKKKAPLVIGTIRMGFGHHRISYAVASFATMQALNKDERDVYFHDIATIGADESSLIDDGESLYSAASQMLTELPNRIERFLSAGTSGGGTNALRLQTHAASLMTSLMDGLVERDSPIIATHPLVGVIAVLAGFTNVINLVVDNHPQWFVVVPGALNLVQGPKLYRELMKLGVPDAEIECVGHWNPRVIVDSIPDSTERRIRRIERREPLRLLIPVGGAGAQESFLVDLVKECVPLVKDKKVELLLNAGDHAHMKTAFEDRLKESKLDFELISDLDGLNAFRDRLNEKKDDDSSIRSIKPVTLFAYTNMDNSSSYSAVITTDTLVPHSDVLVCKPSEMAFYAVPKLMIRRVGDHEAKSAVRAAEVGEGTLEAGTVREVMDEIHQFLTKPNDLITMNRMIRKNDEVGMYDGAKIAVQRALERSTEQHG